MASLPATPDMQQSFVVGIIGLGDMGRLYARKLSQAGWSIVACDREEKYEELKVEFSGQNNIQICRNGHYVSRAGDYVMYNVEASAIEDVIAQYGPSTKINAIVGGQTSCKSVEVQAFERHLPADVDIVLCHSLHGPSVDPANQPLALIPHRASARSAAAVERVLSCLGSRIVYLSVAEHDRITADTQAVTHAAFLSMGKAWHANRQFPWEMSRYVGGVENVKINLMLRIYSQKWHVYAGLAILNPEARVQIEQYARSVTDLYKLMLLGDLDALRDRVHAARDGVFYHAAATVGQLPPPLLQPEILDEFSLGERRPRPFSGDGAGAGPDELRPNSHLSLLAMADCWYQLGIVPYDHMMCSTPLFRFRLGVTEHLFRNADLLEDTLRVAVGDNTCRSEDLEFTFAARGWAECVGHGHFETWRQRFEETQSFFEPRFADAAVVGSRMIQRVLDPGRERKREEDE